MRPPLETIMLFAAIAAAAPVLANLLEALPVLANLLEALPVSER